MTVHKFSLLDQLTDLYKKQSEDPEFSSVINCFKSDNDSDIADLIDIDGRYRIRTKKIVTLDRYTADIPDIAMRPELLDAAIDMTLRSMARSGSADNLSIDKLIKKYPQYERAIREAVALNNAIWSTRQVEQHITTTAIKELPQEWGPMIESGTRRYELRELLGQGAFGQVYLAVDRQLSEDGHQALVSIKVIANQDELPWQRKQIADEATKARRINHPNVAQVIDRGVSEDDEDYIVYEFVDGGDLAQWARPRLKSIDIKSAAEIVMNIANGVHAAHMAGLVHCDLKPSNVVVTSNGQPKVTDFGISVRTEERSTISAEDSDNAEPIGNFAFMSPEQYRMEPGALTIPTDIYALGGILFWLLTGSMPNGSTPEEIADFHNSISNRQQPHSVSKYRKEADIDLEAICQKALAHNPEDRFGSAAQLAEALQSWIRLEPLSWTKPSLVHRVRLWSRRKTGLFIAIILIVIIAIASTISLLKLSSIARQERFDSEVAEAGLKKEEEVRLKFRVNLQRFIAMSKEARDKGLARDVLIGIWIMEWLFEPTVLGDGPERFELWDLRIQLVRDLLKEAQSDGSSDTFTVMLWESALGYWLIRDELFTEAEQILDGNVRKWNAILNPDDPWLIHIQVMYSCAVVGRIAEQGYNADTQSENTELLRTTEIALETGEQVLQESQYGSPLHRLILDFLDKLYSPKLLDNDANRQEFQKQIKTIEDQRQ